MVFSIIILSIFRVTCRWKFIDSMEIDNNSSATEERGVGLWVGQRVVVSRVPVNGRVSGDLGVGVEDSLANGGSDQSHGDNQ